MVFRLWIPLTTIALASLAACNASGPTGCLVRITIDPGHEPVSFDHVTVSVVVGTRHAFACLYPVAGGGAAREATEAGAGDQDPCADLAPDPQVDPTPAVWDLVAKPRTIDIEAGKDESVIVEAYAAYGNARPLAHGTATVSAGSPWAETTLTLSTEGVAAPVICPQRFIRGNAALSEAPNQFRCVGQVLACIDPAMPLNRLGVESTRAIVCGSGQAEGTLRNDSPAVDCPTDEGRYIIYRAAVTAKPCSTLYATLRFARCLDGSRDLGCAATTDCDVPPTIVRDAGRTNPMPNDAKNDLSCIPALPYDVTVDYLRFGANVANGIELLQPASTTRTCTMTLSKLSATSPMCAGQQSTP